MANVPTRRRMSSAASGGTNRRSGQPDIELASSLHGDGAQHAPLEYMRRGIGINIGASTRLPGSGTVSAATAAGAGMARIGEDPGTDYSQTPDSIRDRTLLLSNLGLLAGRRESLQGSRGDAAAGHVGASALGGSRRSSLDDRSSIDMILAEAGPGGGNLSQLLRNRSPRALQPVGDRDSAAEALQPPLSDGIGDLRLPPLNPTYLGAGRVPKNAKVAARPASEGWQQPAGTYGAIAARSASRDRQQRQQTPQRAMAADARQPLLQSSPCADAASTPETARARPAHPTLPTCSAQNGGPQALKRHALAVADLVLWPLQYVPAVVLGLILNLLDGLSYGLIAFPIAEPAFRGLGPAGFSMFMLSTAASQAVFSGGASAFRGANGSMLIEAIPFLHAMCATVVGEVGSDRPDRVVATALMAYACSTLLTGAVFFALGALRIGALVDFFPRHILVGCIGGVGYFLMQTGLEVTSRVPLHLSWSTVRALLAPEAFTLWSSSLGVAVALRALSARVAHPLVVPLFFMAVPAVFYVTAAALGMTLNDLRSHGWVFAQPPSGVPFYHFYTLFDLHNTDWHAVVRTVPTMLGLAFFSVLHVPINVPALAVSTAADRVDTNRELVAHGLSNVLAGALGTFPNYLVYSNSVLFIRSGGASNLAGSMLCVATLAVFVAGPALIGLIPTMVVGALIFHLGLELLREALVDTVGVVSRVEYATIAAIIAAMAALGFNEGIFLGILLACFFFILLYSRRSPLRKAYTGSAVRSTVRRLYGQRRFLDGVCRQIQVMRLQGFMFFGTINGVEASIRSLLEQRQWQANPIRFLVLDFALVTGLDFSAAEAFIRVRRLLEAREIYMVLSGVRRVSDVGRALRAAGVWSGAGPDDSDCVQTFASLNEALEWCENVLLQLYYLHHSSLGVSQQAFVSAGPQRYAFATPTPQPDAAADADAGILGTSPRYAMVERAVQSALPASPPLSPAPAATPALPLLAQAFHELEQEQPVDETLAFVAPRFVRKCLQAGQLLWRVGQRPLGMYVVESGSLRVFVDSATSDASADLADADADIDIDADADADASLIESILPGTTIGELALVTGKPYSTTVVADADVVIWELSQTAFDELCAADPAHMLAFVRLALAYSAQGMKAMTAYAFCAQ